MDVRNSESYLAKRELPFANDLGHGFTARWLFAFTQGFGKSFGIGRAAGGEHGSDGVIVGHV